MINCKKCNAQLEDGSRFCSSCGSLVSENKYCAACGSKVNNEAAFCHNCGASVQAHEGTEPIQEPTQAPTPVIIPAPAPIPAPGQTVPMPVPIPVPAPMPGGNPSINKVKKKFNPVFVIIPVAILLVIASLAVIIPTVLIKLRSTPKQICYLKDDELSIDSLAKLKPKEITDNLYDGGTIKSEESILLSAYIQFSDNNKRVFYPDQFTDEDDGFTIYYRNLNSKQPEGIKVDSDIVKYQINGEGTRMYYLTGDNRNLYFSDLENKDKVEGNVSDFYLDASQQKLLYITGDGEIYRKDVNKEKEKIDSNATIEYVSEDLNMVYYQKDGDLYLKKGDESKKKIASDVFEVIHVYDSGELYYLQAEEVSMKLSDFVNDDLKTSDQAMVQPIEPIYPDYYSYEPTTGYPSEPYLDDYYDYYSWTYDWDSYDADYASYQDDLEAYNKKWEDDYNAAMATYDTEYAAYQTAIDEFYAKLDRDALRETIATETIDVTKYSLFYYDNDKEEMVTDAYSSVLSYSSAKPVIVYERNKQAEYSRIKMSEVTSYDDVYNQATNATSATTENYIAIGKESSAIGDENGSDFTVNRTGDTLYYIDNFDETKGFGDLYEVKIKESKLEKATKYDSDVCSVRLLGEKNIVVCFKDQKDMSADMYVNKKIVDSEVYIDSISDTNGDDYFTYYTDYDEEDEAGTLKIFNGKDSVKVGDDINSYYTYDQRCIAFLSEYDVEQSEGDLYLYTGKDKKKLIDQDVTAIVPFY